MADDESSKTSGYMSTRVVGVVILASLIGAPQVAFTQAWQMLNREEAELKSPEIGSAAGPSWPPGSLAFRLFGASVPMPSWLFGAYSDETYLLDTTLLQADLLGTTGFPFDDLFDISTLPDGRLFGVLDSGELIQIDSSSGVATLVGATGFSGTNALVAASPTSFYGATCDGDFLLIDADSANTALVGSFGSGLGSSGDLAIDRDGVLFGIAHTGSCCNPAFLVVVDPADGHASIVGEVGFLDVFGIAFGPDGTLWGVTDGESASPKLITIDLVSGAGSLVGTLSGAIGMGGLAARQPLFSDGFESGDTSAWSVTVPSVP